MFRTRICSALVGADNVHFSVPAIWDVPGESDPSKVIKVMANEGKSGEPHELAYTNCKVIGNGSFGVVFQAKLVNNSEDAAIKKVLQDKRFKASNMTRTFWRSIATAIHVHRA